jgi:hypothetical protein
VTSLETTTASALDKSFLAEHGIAVPEEVDYRFRTSSDRGNGYLGVEVVPYVMEGGQIKRVKRIVFTANFTPRVESSVS